MFWLGSGPVKGFAVTLSIGVLTSLFSAILVTRLQIVTWLRRSKPKVDPDLRRRAMFRPLIIIRASPTSISWGCTSWASRCRRCSRSARSCLFLAQGLNYGIDFVGGTIIEARTPGPGRSRRRCARSSTGSASATVSLQGFGGADEVLIRLQRQPGGDEAQEEGGRDGEGQRSAIGIEYRRTEVVGPTVGGELIRAGVMATIAGAGRHRAFTSGSASNGSSASARCSRRCTTRSPRSGCSRCCRSSST